ncbi:MAG: hypothetical protein JXJ22_16020 [Bacteroidales bacterium]|nr:hypothetical protein [Bacteroidales bacterium]
MNIEQLNNQCRREKTFQGRQTWKSLAVGNESLVSFAPKSPEGDFGHAYLWFYVLNNRSAKLQFI